MGRSAFQRELARRAPDPGRCRWLFVPYDQLSDAIGPLAREDPAGLGLVLIECPQKAARRPYHKQKLALVLGNLRHFALEQAARGVAVRHVVAPTDYRPGLEPVLDELATEGPVRVMRPAERELREDLRPLVEDGRLEEIPHEGWLTTREQFEHAGGAPPWRMDAFYRRVRRDTGILMEGGKPAGGNRLLPRRVVEDVAAGDLPLASREGFLRQVLGWREFVRHVHEATDGFRRLPDGPAPESSGGAAPSHLAAGDVMTTKPYVSGGAYIDRMSDFCAGCTFDPRSTCPITPMYWAFLARHADRLKDNPRTRLPLGSMRRRSAERKRADRETFERVQRALREGRQLAAE